MSTACTARRKSWRSISDGVACDKFVTRSRRKVGWSSPAANWVKSRRQRANRGEDFVPPLFLLPEGLKRCFERSSWKLWDTLQIRRLAHFARVLLELGVAVERPYVHRIYPCTFAERPVTQPGGTTFPVASTGTPLPIGTQRAEPSIAGHTADWVGEGAQHLHGATDYRASPISLLSA